MKLRPATASALAHDDVESWACGELGKAKRIDPIACCRAESEGSAIRRVGREIGRMCE